MALIQLTDGEVLNFASRHSGGGGGCDTCGYGGECDVTLDVTTSRGKFRLESEDCNFDKVMTAILTSLPALREMSVTQFQEWLTEVWEGASGG